MDLFFVWWCALHFCCAECRLRAVLYASVYKCRTCRASVGMWRVVIAACQTSPALYHVRRRGHREHGCFELLVTYRTLARGQNGSRLQASIEQSRGRLPARKVHISRQMTQFLSSDLRQNARPGPLVFRLYLPRAHVRCCLKSLIISRRARKPQCESSLQRLLHHLPQGCSDHCA